MLSSLKKENNNAWLKEYVGDVLEKSVCFFGVLLQMYFMEMEKSTFCDQWHLMNDNCKNQLKTPKIKDL